jgi:hypothetical protein
MQEDPKVKLDHKENKDHKACRVRRVSKEYKALRESKENRDCLEWSQYRTSQDGISSCVRQWMDLDIHG